MGETQNQVSESSGQGMRPVPSMLALLPQGFCCRREYCWWAKAKHVCPWARGQVAKRAAEAFPDALQSDWRHRHCQGTDFCEAAAGVGQPWAEESVGWKPEL